MIKMYYISDLKSRTRVSISCRVEIGIIKYKTGDLHLVQDTIKLGGQGGKKICTWMTKMKIRVKIELMLLFCADARVNAESKPFCVGTRIKLGFPFFLFHQHVSERIWYCCHCHGESWETASVRLGPQETLHIFWRYFFIHSLAHSFIYRTNWGPIFCNILVLASMSLKSRGGVKPGTHYMN